ncbi:6-phosphofructo-2-kinase-domain-containing protein [Dimargaris cristalligena]|uniref:6-phosphofructo-2-kinase-domain-containing protein n=1 Tax=Dimargaris cristalligena TaxID=215637 RepID=A0A4Q0A2I9_9FUNG|nr:6-phosphofructo-2-kinase-domain-containing protein [Dimargaris cristalligena]|eukprot:RKP39390.1 6-phosphofructo-2-kinase-domain-containing protein [Dimargaris cristalligena]
MSSPESPGSGVPGTYIQRTAKAPLMVGLPARGKSYIVKKLKRYLNWLGYLTRIFNVGNRRRTKTAAEQFAHKDNEPNHNSKFFDPDNSHAKAFRDQLAMDSLDELIHWLNVEHGQVAIHDATNSTRDRRRMILDRCQREPNLSVLFVESICDDQSVIRHNVRMKLMSPDYINMDPADARRDFLARLRNYERAYQPLGAWEERRDVQYCKIINVGKKIIANNIQGYLAGQCVFYLMNMNLARRQFWITRHGESLDNNSGQIGGDASLTQKGRIYAEALTSFVGEQRAIFEANSGTSSNSPILLPGLSRSSSLANRPYQPPKFSVWTSMLRRTIETVEQFDPVAYDIRHIRALNEIYAGSCEGMTYKEIQGKFPAEFAARQANKLYYRYPGMGGESYADVIQRLSPLIVELERTTHSALIVTHNAMTRTLLAYMMDIPTTMMTTMDVPLHTVYCVEPKPFGNECRQYRFNFESCQFELVEDD